MNCQHIKSDTQRMNSYSKDTLHYYILFLTHLSRPSHSNWRHETSELRLAMQYETSEGHCVVAPLRCDTRLQQFVARSFREQLGRQSGALHVNVRQYAAGWHKGTTG